MTCTLWSTVEHLPQGPVLVWDGFDQLVACQIGGVWHEIMTGKRLRGVTHWTTLPEPPRGAA